jgi:hypothetical protein
MRSRLFFACLALIVLSLPRTKATHAVGTSKPLNGVDVHWGFQTCKNQFRAKTHRRLRGHVLCILSNGLTRTGHPLPVQLRIPARSLGWTVEAMERLNFVFTAIVMVLEQLVVIPAPGLNSCSKNKKPQPSPGSD